MNKFGGIEEYIKELGGRYDKLEFIWMREYDVLVGLKGGGLKKEKYKEGLKGVEKGLYTVKGIIVGIGETDEVSRSIKRVWMKSKKGNEIRGELQVKYKKVKDKGVKLKRVEEAIKRLIKDGEIKGVYRGRSEQLGELRLDVNGVKYYFGVNYGVREINGVEEELYEIVPHKESLRTAVEKCKSMGVGIWIKDILRAYDLRRKEG